MKVLLVGVAAIGSLCVSPTFGQGRMIGPGRVGGGNFHGGMSSGFRRGPSAGSFHSGRLNNQFGKFGFGNRFGFGNQFGNGFGFGLPFWGGVDPYSYGFNSFFDPFYARYAGFDNDEAYQQPAQPNVIV